MADNRTIIGTDYLLFINTGTTVSPVWKVPLCQTTLTLNTPKDVIDSSSKCGTKSDTVPGQETIEFEGLILAKDPANPNHMSLFDLRQIFRDGDSFEFRAGPRGETAADDGKIIYSGTGKFTSLSDTYPNKDNATATGSISVNGELTEIEYVFTT